MYNKKTSFYDNVFENLIIAQHDFYDKMINEIKCRIITKILFFFFNNVKIVKK